MAERLVLDLFLFFKEALWGKIKWYAAWFQYILIPLNLAYNKNKLHKTLDYWSRDMHNFHIFRKGSPLHFLNDFFAKMFLMLYSIIWPYFIVWLPSRLEISANMCIGIVCSPGCDVINFEINLLFPVKSFFYMTKRSRHKFKYLENEKSS